MHDLSAKTIALLLTFVSLPTFADEAHLLGAGELTGSASIVNKYIYRGGVENDDVALQAGLEYAHPRGFLVGYWGSTLDYDATDDSHHSGFEHDFYLGYGRKINADWSYETKITSYVYQNGGSVYSEDRTEKRRTTGFDVSNSLNYKNLNLGLAVLLADVSYGNAGDVYLSAGYDYALPQDFTLKTAIGASIYNDHGDDAVVQTVKQNVFSEARLGLTKALGNTGVELAFDYVWGGKNRMGESFDDQTVIGLNYSF